MRILITGFSARSSNSQRLQKQYLCPEPLFQKLLEELGHTVEHRAVVIGEDLSGFDRAFLFVNYIKSTASKYAAETAYAFQEVPSYPVFCDWSGQLISETRNAFENWERHSRFAEWAWKYTPYHIELVRSMTEAFLNEPLTCVGLVYPWGNHQLLGDKNFRIHSIDPSCLVEFPPIVQHDPAERSREWIYAVLQKHAWVERLGLTWPIVRYGLKGQIHLSEPELMQEYARAWGSLTLPCKTAGSGWWRPRFNHAAHAGSVMVCDPRDSKYMGAAYQISHRDVEKMSTQELAELADQQSLWFQKNIASKQKTIDTMNKILEETL